MEKNKPHWEKLGLYLAVTTAFMTLIFYIADMKERIAKLEVKVEIIEKERK